MNAFYTVTTSRRSFLRVPKLAKRPLLLVRVAVLLQVIVSITWGSDSTAAEPQPNIIFILADDLSSANGKGGPDGSFYGNVDVAEQLTDRGLKFIEENRDGPFFLYLAHWDVHTPHRARKEIVSRYQSKLAKIPESQRRNFDPVYAAMIEAVDQSVGRVAAKVDELGLAENTLIVFTSDNGGPTGSPGIGCVPVAFMDLESFDDGDECLACIQNVCFS